MNRMTGFLADSPENEYGDFFENLVRTKRLASVKNDNPVCFFQVSLDAKF